MSKNTLRNIFYLTIIGNTILSGTLIERGKYDIIWFLVDAILLFLFFVNVNNKDNE